MRIRRRSFPILAVALAIMASACSGAGAPKPAVASPKVAFFQDLSLEDPLDLVSPSFLALGAGLADGARGGVGNVPVAVQFDTGGDPLVALELAQTVAADDSYVAIVAAPFWAMSEEVAVVFATAGLPLLSLSDGALPAVPGLVWRRFVAPAPAQAEELSARAARSAVGPVCIVDEGSTRSQALAAAVARRLAGRAAPREAGDTGGCHAVVWTGGPSGAVSIRASLDPAIPLLVSDAAKAAGYLDAANPASDGTVAVCPCLDVSTDTSIEARRFVNVYQAATGLAPGVYAAEGWEVAILLVRLAGDAAVAPRGRAGFRSAIGALVATGGIAGDVTFDAHGDPTGELATAHATRAAGLRWIVSA